MDFPYTCALGIPYMRAGSTHMLCCKLQLTLLYANASRAHRDELQGPDGALAHVLSARLAGGREAQLVVYQGHLQACCFSRVTCASFSTPQVSNGQSSCYKASMICATCCALQQIGTRGRGWPASASPLQL